MQIALNLNILCPVTVLLTLNTGLNYSSLQIFVGKKQCLLIEMRNKNDRNLTPHMMAGMKTSWYYRNTVGMNRVGFLCALYGF